MFYAELSVPVLSLLPILFRDIQKATENFTTLLGQGSYGPVYKAKMPNGAVLAVKVLASDSKQGEKEFQTEVRVLFCILSLPIRCFSVGWITSANISYL